MYHFIWLLFIAPLNHGAGSSGSLDAPPEDVPPPGSVAVVSELPFNLDLDGAFSFEKHEDDRKCIDAPPIQQSPGSFTECKTMCLKEIRCKFMMWYSRRRWCETYASCEKTVPENKVAIWKVISPCDKAVPRYHELIPQHIPPIGIVRGTPPNQNIHCACQTFAWMYCAIFFSEGAEQDAIFAKFGDKTDEEKLKPFFTMVSLMRPNQKPICFLAEPLGGFPPVYAEVDNWPRGKCFNVQQCIDGTPNGVCPIMKRPFSSGNAVYIKRIDEDKALHGNPVPCISMTGLRADLTHETSIANGGIRDPLNPSNDILMTEDMFDIYFVFNDAQMTKGACLPVLAGADNSPASSASSPALETGPMASSSRRRGGKKSKKGSPSIAASSPRTQTDTNTDVEQLRGLLTSSSLQEEIRYPELSESRRGSSVPASRAGESSEARQSPPRSSSSGRSPLPILESLRSGPGAANPPTNPSTGASSSGPMSPLPVFESLRQGRPASESRSPLPWPRARYWAREGDVRLTPKSDSPRQTLDRTSGLPHSASAQQLSDPAALFGTGRDLVQMSRGAELPPTQGSRPGTVSFSGSPDSPPLTAGSAPKPRRDPSPSYLEEEVSSNILSYDFAQVLFPLLGLSFLCSLLWAHLRVAQRSQSDVYLEFSSF